MIGEREVYRFKRASGRMGGLHGERSPGQYGLGLGLHEH